MDCALVVHQMRYLDGPFASRDQKALARSLPKKMGSNLSTFSWTSNNWSVAKKIVLRWDDAAFQLSE